MVNKFTPSNIKRTANQIMEEWEKSLIEPQSAADKENSF
jgi:ribosomal protein S17E